MWVIWSSLTLCSLFGPFLPLREVNPRKTKPNCSDSFTNISSKPCLLLEVRYQNYNRLNLETSTWTSAVSSYSSPPASRNLFDLQSPAAAVLFFSSAPVFVPLPVFIKLVKFLPQLCQPRIMLCCAHHNALQLPGNQVWRWHAKRQRTPSDGGEPTNPSRRGGWGGQTVEGWNWGVDGANFPNFSSLCSRCVGKGKPTGPFKASTKPQWPWKIPRWEETSCRPPLPTVEVSSAVFQRFSQSDSSKQLCHGWYFRKRDTTFSFLQIK